MEGALRCVLTFLLGMSAVVRMDTHWMEMECLAMVSFLHVHCTCMPDSRIQVHHVSACENEYITRYH